MLLLFFSTLRFLCQRSSVVLTFFEKKFLSSVSEGVLTASVLPQSETIKSYFESPAFGDGGRGSECLSAELRRLSLVGPQRCSGSLRHAGMVLGPVLVGCW